MFYILMIAIFGASLLVGWRFKSKFKKYSRMPISSGYSGRDVAEKMLRDHGISGVDIIEGHGALTDHYNPLTKTVSLSPEVYRGQSVAAAAVAAHECGHAVQHAKEYSFLKVRSALVPVQNASSKILNFVFLASIIGGFVLYSSFPFHIILPIIIGAYGVMTLFAFITLPVEFDASNRALKWLETAGITGTREHQDARNALNAAAMTYVVSALGSLAMLLYYLSIFIGNRD